MSNEVVKYHNDMNRLIMRDWTPEEMDFFFAIVWKIRNHSTKEISVGKNELSKLAEYSRKHNIELRRIFRRLAKQMHRLIWENESFDGKMYRYEVMPMFTRASFEWNKEMTDMTAYFQITDAFTYLVNDLSANFTSWELKEFTSIRSTYAKTAYRLLKQYRSTGYRKFNVEEFRLLFDIPKSYKACNVQTRVLKPILTELKPYFFDLKIKPIKKRTHGNPIIEYEFRWQPSLIEDWDDQKYDKKALATSQRVKQKKKANDPTWYDDKETHQASDELIEQALEVQKSRKEQQ